MRLTPRYDGPDLLRFEDPLEDPAVPLLRQRHRLGEVLGTLDDDQWMTASRCEGWSVRDVVAHLVGTNVFWVQSIRAALAGSPTRYLTGFDPVTGPAEIVAGMGDLSPDDVHARYLKGVALLADLVGGLDEAQWGAPAEAPPGHMPLHGVALHALWDAWVHERDILLPLGMTPVEEPDELRASLQYAAGLGPALLAIQGSTRSATLLIDGHDPDVHFVVQAGETVVVRSGESPTDAVRLTGPTADLIEALSCRAPPPHAIPEHHRWLLEGLPIAFDQLPTTD
jgi:uncharacterized protein (TIGR03083 family)